MPFPNEHSARLIAPGRFTEGSSKPINLTRGVDAIIGKLKGVFTDTKIAIGGPHASTVDRKILDKLTIKVELSPESAAKTNLDRNALLKKITDELVAVITIRPKIELLEPKTIPRSVGKAVRVVDMRKRE